MATGLDTTELRQAAQAPPLGPADERTAPTAFMRRLAAAARSTRPPGSAQGARKAFQTSLVGGDVPLPADVRRVPVRPPLLGLAKGVGPAIGLVISVVDGRAS